MAEESEKRPYSPAEVAEMLGRDIKTVYEGIRRKQIPSVRMGRLILIPRGAFERWRDTGNAA